MSYNLVDSTTGDLTRVAGGTLYADNPIGSIIPFGSSAIPSGYLLCNGQEVSRTAYSELFEAIGTAFGAGNSTTTFNVPDLRETVPVGADQSTRAILSEDGHDHDVYALGEFKDDQMQEHTHQYLSPKLSTDVVGLVPGFRICSTSIDVKTDTNSGRIGTTTHGKQVGVNYIIKAKQVGVPVDFMNAVAETNSYSTTETVVGKWIDGKPIYRKVFYSPTNWNDGTIVGNIETPDVVLTVHSTSQHNNGNWFTDYNESGLENTAFIKPNGDITVVRSGAFQSDLKALVIVEYTKTTD